MFNNKALLTIISILLLSWVLLDMPFSKNLAIYKIINANLLGPMPNNNVFVSSEEYNHLPRNTLLIQNSKIKLKKLRSEPCNQTFKKEFVASLNPYFKALTYYNITGNLTSEQLTYFNELRELFSNAIMDGLIEKKDMPLLYKFSLSHNFFKSKSACKK